MMVNRLARDQAVRLLKDLALGRITNDEYEDRQWDIARAGDIAICDVFRYGSWGLYSDTHEYKLTGKNALSRSEKQYVARLILFLKSDQEYRWLGVVERLRFTGMGISCLFWLLLGGFCFWGGVQSGAYWVELLGAFLVFWALMIFCVVVKPSKGSQIQAMELEDMGADVSVWPFYSHKAYDDALMRPVYLNGARSCAN